MSTTSHAAPGLAAAIRFAHEMRNDDTGELAATMVVVAVHLDRETRKARSLPTDVREGAVAMIAGESGLRT